MSHSLSIPAPLLVTFILSACHTTAREPYTPLPPVPLSASDTDSPQVALNVPESTNAADAARKPGRSAATVPSPLAPPTDTNGDMTVKSVAGVWNASISGKTCKLATPQTKFGEGFRAGPLRCPTPLDSVKSWNVANQELVLYGATGAVLARLHFSTGRYDGKFNSGEPITLSR